MIITPETTIALSDKHVTVSVLEHALSVLRKHGTVVISIVEFNKQDRLFSEVPTLAEVLFTK